MSDEPDKILTVFIKIGEILLFLSIFAFLPYTVFFFFDIGEFDSGIVLLFITMALIVGYIYFYHVSIPREVQWFYAREMYNLPQDVREYGGIWDKELQEVIKKAIETTTDSEELSDLKHCQRVAKEMTKNFSAYSFDSLFLKIHKAFRLTGCHFTITDSKGNIITRIV